MTRPPAVRVEPGVPAPRCAKCNKERPALFTLGKRLATEAEVATAQTLMAESEAYAHHGQHDEAWRTYNHARSYAHKDGDAWVHVIHVPSGYYSPDWAGSFCSMQHAHEWAEDVLRLAEADPQSALMLLARLRSHSRSRSHAQPHP